MATVTSFFDVPTVAFMNVCKKELELVKIADHYGIVVSGSSRKGDIKEVILSSLFEQGVLQKSDPAAEEPMSVPVLQPEMVKMSGLSFEQQKEIFVMQLEMEKLQQDREKERQFEVEKLLELENSK